MAAGIEVIVWLPGAALPGPVHPQSSSKLGCEVGRTRALSEGKEPLCIPPQGLSARDMRFCDATW